MGRTKTHKDSPKSTTNDRLTTRSYRLARPVKVMGRSGWISAAANLDNLFNLEKYKVPHSENRLT